MTASMNIPADWLLVQKPDFMERVGRIQHVLFDFDGTISVLRQGWEGIMIPMMLDKISPHAPASPVIEQEVRSYVDQSTGILTIRQMAWLAEAVERYGMADQVLSAAEYKSIYVQLILQKVHHRVIELDKGQKTAQDFMVSGAQAWIEALTQKGINLYLASGTDHRDVLNEARILGVERYFIPRIYGALDESEAHDKELIIQRILEQNKLQGDELLVVGDGPVEIRVAAAHGAIALGLASDEIARQGWNLHKIVRLQSAGADALIPDFRYGDRLMELFFAKD